MVPHVPSRRLLLLLQHRGRRRGRRRLLAVALQYVVGVGRGYRMPRLGRVVAGVGLVGARALGVADGGGGRRGRAHANRARVSVHVATLRVQVVLPKEVMAMSET